MYTAFPYMTISFGKYSVDDDHCPLKSDPSAILDQKKVAVSGVLFAELVLDI